MDDGSDSNYLANIQIKPINDDWPPPPISDPKLTRALPSPPLSDPLTHQSLSHSTYI